MSLRHTLAVAAMLMASFTALAQIPTNAQKQFEYSEALSVKKAASRELQQRFIYWAKDQFTAGSYIMEVDDTNNRVVIVHVTHPMLDNHFGVNRTHKERVLKYTLKFDAEKKDYTYWLNNITYSCVEIDKKGVETTLNGPLEGLKTATKQSLEEEINNVLVTVIESFKKRAEMDLSPEAKAEIEAIKAAKAEAEAARKAMEAQAKEAQNSQPVGEEGEEGEGGEGGEEVESSPEDVPADEETPKND